MVVSSSPHDLPMVGTVWEGGDGSRGDRIARVGGLIDVFSFFYREFPLFSKVEDDEHK
jgi:hypothetical protein